MLTAVRRRSDNRNVTDSFVRNAADLLNEPVTVMTGHCDVTQDNVRAVILHEPQRIDRIRRRQDEGAVSPEGESEIIQVAFVIINDDDRQPS